MAIAVRGVGTVDGAAVAITPGLPTGTQAGDFLLLFLETSDQTISIATPSGWLEAPNSPVSETTDVTRLTVFYKVAVAGETAPTTTDSGDHQIGRIIGFTGVNINNPFDVTASGTDATSSTTGTVPGATTTVANTMVVAAIATTTDAGANSTAHYSGFTNANLTNLTERIDNQRIAGNGGTLGVATGDFASIGSYGGTDFTIVTAARKAMWSCALKPQPDFVFTLNNYQFPDASTDNTGIISVTEKIK